MESSDTLCGRFVPTGQFLLCAGVTGGGKQHVPGGMTAIPGSSFLGLADAI